MTDDRTHRCIDCPQRIEHHELELCPSCGRCDDHCDQLNHKHMSRREEPGA
jgi:hypothetical protein